jgi:hypothetical protein
MTSCEWFHLSDFVAVKPVHTFRTEATCKWENILKRILMNWNVVRNRIMWLMLKLQLMYAYSVLTMLNFNLLTVHSQWVTGAYCNRRFRCPYFYTSTRFICFPPTPVPSNSCNSCSITPLASCLKRLATFEVKIYVEYILFIYAEWYKVLGILSPLWSVYLNHLCRQSPLMSQLENKLQEF